MLAQTYGAAHPLLAAATSKSELLLNQFQTALSDVVAAERNRFEMLGREESELRAGGPDRQDDGLALYSLHHKTFDRGAFTVAVRIGPAASGVLAPAWEIAPGTLVPVDGSTTGWR